VTCEDFERSEEEEVEFGRLLTYVQVRKSANFLRTFEESEMLTSQEVYGIPNFGFLSPQLIGFCQFGVFKKEAGLRRAYFYMNKRIRFREDSVLNR
jgi:hypothetical protein